MMAGRRKQWQMQGVEGYRPFNSAPVKARPRNDHSYHLMMLQERNRLMRKLSQKGEKEVEMERKEQGFSLYLNGANTTTTRRHHRRAQPGSSAVGDIQPQTRPSQTAGGVEKESHDQEGRSKTAPSRKSWSHDNVVVRTEDGGTVPVTVPGIISGCYDDDFESSAAEMTDDSESEVGDFGEGCEDGEESEAHSTEAEEVTDSFQCSSLENTLTSSHQDSLGGSGQNMSVLKEGRDSVGGESRNSEPEEENEEEYFSARRQEDHGAGTATRTLADITERVRELNHRGQRKLLEVLHTLSSEATPTATPTSAAPDWLQPQSKPPPLVPPLPPPLPPPLLPPLPPPLLPPLSGAVVCGRPVSTRSTGLRGEITRNPLNSGADEPSSVDGVSNSRSWSRPFRSASGRTSGIRGQTLSRAQSEHTLGATETEGRGGLLTPGQASSEPHLLHHSRPHTVLINDTEPLPLVTDDELCCDSAHSHHSRPQTYLINDTEPLPLLTDDELCCDSTHWPHPPSPDLNDSLASLSFFDHTHQGQLGTTTTDEGLLKTFLADYNPQMVAGQELVTDSHNKQTDTHDPSEGQQLVLNLLTTWGDQFYVGLTGLEIFTASGERASVTQITADPADINVLLEYSGDPRIVSNLLDGVNHTKDDLHMWLAPFTPSHPHTVTLSFSSPTSLALVRVWNYNKSRIHSYRGVRHMEMWLDHQLIFRGEIRRASGGILDRAGKCGETILFTTDKEVLFRVGLHDNQFLEEIARCHRNSHSSQEHGCRHGEKQN